MRLVPLLLLIAVSAVGQDVQGLRFVQNKGQWNNDIDFQAQVPGGRLGVSANGFSIVLLDLEEMERRHLQSHGEINESTGHSSSDPIDGHYFRINLLGANPSKPIVESPLDGYYNYFLGSDTCRWATNALAYSTILYPNIYEGIDFRVSSIGKNLKYDFIVKPGADPSRIRIAYEGVDGVEKSEDEIKIKTVVGILEEQKPYSYQANGRNKETVASEYQLDNNIVSFSFPDGYDASHTLVIDPLLIFSTYSGSTADNWGSTATPGEHGTLYSAGVTNQDDGGFFPATPGAFQTFNRGNYDMAIIKYDSAGTKFLYATHLGGANNDSPQSLVVDKATGDLIVLGISSSENYPTGTTSFDRVFNGGTSIFNRVINTTDKWDIVLTRLSSAGNILVGSTFLGGSGNDGLNLPKQSGGPLVANYGDEMRGDVITDEAGNVYLSSVTSSIDFPIVNGFDNIFDGTNGATDGVVIKMTPDLSSIVWSSYVGGSGFDACYSIKFDNNKNIVLAGGTTSADFPVTAGAYQPTFKGIVDGWIARVAADGSAIMHATYTGTNSFDQVYFVDLNSAGNIFVYGQTAGHMPITPGVFNKPNSGQFLQKFSSDLSTLGFSTVFGSGSTNGLVIPNISPTAFLVNDCDNIYMSGWGGFVNSSSQTGFWQSTTFNMPITPDAHQKTTSGSDFYFIVLNGDATKLVYSTYLGGKSSKTHVDGGTSRFDKYGVVYHSVCSGCTFGNSTGGATSDFPTTPNAKSRVNLSSNCNNAAFKFDLSSLNAVFETNNLAMTMPGFNNVCYPDSIVFENLSTGGKTIAWDFGDQTALILDDQGPKNVIHQYQQPGQYEVKLKITDLSTCSQTDSTVKVINYFKDNIKVGADEIICEGNSVQLKASGGVDYSWTNDVGTFSSSQQSPVVQPTKATAYFVTVVDANGCSRTDTLNVHVTPNVHAFFQTFDVGPTKPGYNNVCYPKPILFKNQSLHGDSIAWDFDDGTEVSQDGIDPSPVTHLFQEQGVYHVKLKAYNPHTCNKVDSVVKVINYFKAQIEVSDDSEICEGTTFQLTASGGTNYHWANKDLSFFSASPSPVVQPSSSTYYIVTATDGNGCVKSDTVNVAVVDSVNLEWKHHLDGSCSGRPYVVVKNLTLPEDDVTFQFDFGDGFSSDQMEVVHEYEKDGLYTLKLTGQRKFCNFVETVPIPIYEISVRNAITPEGSSGYNDYFEIGFGPDGIPPANVGIPVQVTIVDRWGKQVFESMDYKNDWQANDLVGGVYYVHLKVGDYTTCKSWLHIVK